MKLQEIVKKINGKIAPQGETNIDNERFENLKNQCDLVFELLSEIIEVSKEKERHEFSIKKAGEYADNFIYEVIGLKKD